MLYLLFLFSYLINISLSYTIQYSNFIPFYEGNVVKPYTINLRDSNYILICYEQRDTFTRAGDCKTGNINIPVQNITFSNDYIFEETSATDPFQLQLYPSNRLGQYFIVAYTNSATSARGPGVAIMGKYNNDGSIEYGLKKVFNPGLNDQSNLIELQANNLFIVCGSEGNNGFDLTACRIGNYNITTLQIGFSDKYYDVTEEIRTDGMGSYRVDGSHFIICYGRGILEIGVCNIGAVVGTPQSIDSSIVYSNNIIFNSDGGTNYVRVKPLAIIDSTQYFIICYTTRDHGACSVGIITHDGNTYYLTFGDKKEYDIDGTTEPDIIVIPPGQPDLANTDPLIVVCYGAPSSGGVCRIGYFSLDTKELSFNGNAWEFETRNIGGIDAVYLGDNKMVVCYVQFSGSTPYFNKGGCRYGTLYY